MSIPENYQYHPCLTFSSDKWQETGERDNIIIQMSCHCYGWEVMSLWDIPSDYCVHYVRENCVWCYSGNLPVPGLLYCACLWWVSPLWPSPVCSSLVMLWRELVWQWHCDCVCILIPFPIPHPSDQWEEKEVCPWLLWTFPADLLVARHSSSCLEGQQWAGRQWPSPVAPFMLVFDMSGPTFWLMLSRWWLQEMVAVALWPGVCQTFICTVVTWYSVEGIHAKAYYCLQYYSNICYDNGEAFVSPARLGEAIDVSVSKPKTATSVDEEHDRKHSGSEYYYHANDG